MKVGVIGLGNMGLLHASILNRIDNCSLEAVADKNPLKRFGMKFLGIDTKFYTNPSKMLENALDAVFIAVPSALNYDLVSLAAEKGSAVFLEKPLANNLHSASKICSLLNEKNFTNGVGYMLAYDPVFIKGKEYIEGDFSAWIYSSRPRAKWFFNEELSGGGAITSIGSHLFFLLLEYYGKLKAVKADVKPIEGYGEVGLEFQSGVKGKASIAWKPKDGLDIGISTNEHTLDYFGIRSKFHRCELPREEFVLGGPGFYSQDKDFIDCTISGKKPRVDWKKGLDVQRVIDGCYRSKGKWVHV